MTATTETPGFTDSKMLMVEARELLDHCGPQPALCVVEHWRRLHGTLVDGECDVLVGGSIVVPSLSQHPANALRRLMRAHQTAVQTRWEALDWLAPCDGERWLPLPGLPYSGHDGYTGGWVSVLIHPERDQ